MSVESLRGHCWIEGVPLMIRSDKWPKHGPPGVLVAALLVASGLLWAVMFLGSLAHLTRLADGMPPFDIRPLGYSYAEAHAFLAAIG